MLLIWPRVWSETDVPACRRVPAAVGDAKRRSISEMGFADAGVVWMECMEDQERGTGNEDLRDTNNSLHPASSLEQNQQPVGVWL